MTRDFACQTTCYLAAHRHDAATVRMYVLQRDFNILVTWETRSRSVAEFISSVLQTGCSLITKLVRIFATYIDVEAYIYLFIYLELHF